MDRTELIFSIWSQYRCSPGMLDHAIESADRILTDPRVDPTQPHVRAVVAGDGFAVGKGD